MKHLSLNESIHLLAILRLGDKAYGVNIRDEISEMSGRSISYGTLYSYLDQLYRKGLVDKQSGDPTPERGGRRKIFYTVTKKGMAALKVTRELSQSVWIGATEILK